MVTKTQTDKLLPALATWDLADLRELQAALTGLIEALEPSPEVTVKEMPAPEPERPQSAR
ncbi:MAG: hypothetical protein F6K42_19695, partial [Leptolyngbya sp. SIO1D8]|nr:hypothetical protein [Leptolyngbya sp. SIO1D8]